MSLQKHCTYLLSLVMGVALAASTAHAAPDSFVYEGVLEDTSGPITTSATLVLKIYDPAQGCLLYEEGQIVTPATDGSFSIRVGSAIANIKRTANDPGLTMGSVFASSGTIRGTGTANCTAGYVATSSESRRLVINVNGSDLTPAIELSSAPFAINAGNADKVGNYDSSKILRTDGTASIAALNDAKVTILQNLLNGTLSSSPISSGEAASKGYVDGIASNMLPLTTTFAGDVSGNYNTLSVNAIKGKAVDDTGIASGKVLKYDGAKWVMGADNVGSSLTLGDGKIFVGNASGATEVSVSGDANLSNTGALTLASTITAGGPVGTSGYVPVITYDAKGRLTAVSSAAVNDASKLPLAGGMMSGAIDMNSQAISNAGDISMSANKYFKLSNNGTSGSVAGQMWFDGSNIKFHDGTLVRTLGVAGAGITSLNGLTSSTQTFGIGTSGDAPSFSSVSDGHTLNIPMASASGTVTAGLISNADYVAMTAKQTSSLADSSIWIGNNSGKAQARAMSGDATISNTGVLTVNKTQTAEASKILQLNALGVANTGGMFASAADGTPYTSSSGSNKTPTSATHVTVENYQGLNGGASYYRMIATNSVGNDQHAYIGTVSSSGAAAWAPSMVFGHSTASTAYTEAMRIQNSNVGIGTTTPATKLDVSGVTRSTGFDVNPTYGGNQLSIRAPASFANYTLTLPTTPGTPSQVLQTDGAGFLSWVTPAAGGMSSALAPTKFWVGNASGGAEAFALSGDINTVSNTGAVTIKKTTVGSVDTILSLDGSGYATAQGFVAKGVGTVTMLPPSGAANYQLRLPSAAPATDQIMKSDGSGNLTWVNMATGSVTSISGAYPIATSGSVSSPTISLSNPSSGFPFYKWDGSAWLDTHLNVTDLRSSAGGFGPQFPTGCTNQQTMVWVSIADAYQCQDIKIADMVKMTTAVMIFYVTPTGDDATCNGQFNQPSGMAPNCAARTLQGALDKVPDIIKHNVTIYVESLGLPGSNQTMAMINKAVAATDPVMGPFLKIEGMGGTYKTLYGNGYTGSVGLVVGPLSRGVYLKNLNIDGFREEGLSVNGGLVLLENISMNDNATAIRASGGAQVVHQGPSALQISVANLGGSDGSRGIEIFQASMHTESGLNINIGSSLNNRGISISQGELGLEGGMSDIISFASNYLTGIEISPGGNLYIENSHTLRVNMGNNSNASAINVRGGSLTSSGYLELMNISGQGLICESGAKCLLYGSFRANSGAGRPYVAVRGNSYMQSQGYFEIGGPEGSGSAGLEITDNSIFKFNPFSVSQTFSMTGNSGNVGNVAIRLKNGSRFIFEGGMNNPTLDIANYQKLFEASGNSSFTVEGNTGGVSAVPGEAYVDETSTSKSQTNIPVPVPFRACTGGLVPVGKGPGAFCIDSSSMGVNTYTGAMNICNDRGLKLCSKVQYAQFCASGNTVSGLHWTIGMEDMSCNNSSVSVTNDTGFNTNYQFRCCL
ncbi:hypothetical protein [Bdellovibrio sp. HCB337]|uniref:hypothetical protein n=1 Tax=Bdellovibrio sp. HCB337 TaxID=3394358 RepID=UPI0039A5A3F1